jgi:hypothetical protein
MSIGDRNRCVAASGRSGRCEVVWKAVAGCPRCPGGAYFVRRDACTDCANIACIAVVMSDGELAVKKKPVDAQA